MTEADPAEPAVGSVDPDCLFCRIVAGSIPSDKVSETSTTFAFRDIAPQAPTHILVVPKRHVTDVAELARHHEGLLGDLTRAVADIADAEGVSDYRVVFNRGAGAGQTVFHVHAHLLAGRPLQWPPG